MPHVQRFNRYLTPAPKPVPSTLIKSSITTFLLVVFTSLVTIQTPKFKKLKIYPLLKMSSNVPYHFLEEFVLNRPTLNPSTTTLLTIPKKSILIIVPPTQIQPTILQTPNKLSPRVKVLAATDAEKDVATKDPPIHLQSLSHNLEISTTIANVAQTNPTLVNPIRPANNRHIRRVPAVKSAVPDDFKISPLFI